MLTLTNAQHWMEQFFQEIISHKEHLSDLDNPIGDGDHGINMARGVEATMDALATKEIASINELFKTIAMTLLGKVGGAAGPLYGSVFLAFAKASLDLESLNKENVMTLFEEGQIALMNRGKAGVGEKTMVDVWVPFTAQFKKGPVTVADVDNFVEATKPLKATKGRAAYLGERSMGHVDPGSYSSGLLFKTFLALELF
jgi:dihydroxyacetone kinase-like protein